MDSILGLWGDVIRISQQETVLFQRHKIYLRHVFLRVLIAWPLLEVLPLLVFFTIAFRKNTNQGESSIYPAA